MASTSPLQRLKPLKSLTLVSVVDNATDGLSSPCVCCGGAADGAAGAEAAPAAKYTSEFGSGVAGRWKESKELPFLEVCNAGHGLSLLAIADTTHGERHVSLFDAGPTPDLWSSNAKKLRLSLEDVETVVLSHWHIDHSGGLRSAVPAIAAARAAASKPPPVVDLHPDWPVARGLAAAADGSTVRFSPPDPSPDELRGLGGDVVTPSADTGHLASGDTMFVSGAIPRLTAYEVGLPGHRRLHRVGDDGAEEWADDPVIADERYAAFHVAGCGLVVLSACSHAGVVNVARDAAAQAGGVPVFAVVGGFHLAGKACEGRVSATVSDLAALRPEVLVPGHCTGWRAMHALHTAFPGRVQPLVVGGVYTVVEK